MILLVLTDILSFQRSVHLYQFFLQDRLGHPFWNIMAAWGCAQRVNDDKTYNLINALKEMVNTTVQNCTAVQFSDDSIKILALKVLVIFFQRHFNSISN